MKPGTFAQIYIHVIFSVRNRQKLISPTWEPFLYKYIAALVQNRGQKLMIINGAKDHVHLLIGIKPFCRISDLIRDVKRTSTKFVNTEGYTKSKFQWQEGYSVFSYSTSSVRKVISYIERQKEHHVEYSFEQEYIDFLDRFNVEYNEKYLFG